MQVYDPAKRIMVLDSGFPRSRKCGEKALWESCTHTQESRELKGRTPKYTCSPNKPGGGLRKVRAKLTAVAFLTRKAST